jgi:nickel-dependent lactate racemase
LPFLFRTLLEILGDVKQLDFMVALGTHPTPSEDNLNRLVGITAREREKLKPRLLNHAWNDPSALIAIGIMEQDEIRDIVGEHRHPSLPDRVPIRINKAVMEYDLSLFLAPPSLTKLPAFLAEQNTCSQGFRARRRLMLATGWEL